jgi:predicted DNA-binding transcriptional regulator AlpA
MASRKCDPVGAVEIAERLGVSRRTVDQWRQRDTGFPEPRWRVGGRPAWNFDDVERWAKASGRVPAGRMTP